MYMASTIRNYSLRRKKIMNKRKILSLLLSSLLLVSLLAACAGGDSGGDDEIVLTMGSWRADDVDQMNALLAEYKEVAPNVTIRFQPTNPPDYNATLRVQLEGGTGPDLMYARSYATGQELFNLGFFADVTDIPGLMDNFTASSLAPWQMPDGKMFAVPFAAVSQVIYYNKDIFAANGLSVPTTWAEFISVCEALLTAGVTPLANGVADEWDILECFTLGMIPNYIGGADARVQYETGARTLDDQNFIDLFTDIQSVAGFLPNGFEAVTYNDSQALFANGTAAMFADGSWSLGIYDDVDFDWGVFAFPARNAADTAICFHPDMAITMNAATEHPEEARAFLEWLCTAEGAATASKALPVGFFPMINAPIALDNPRANEALALNTGRVTDARFVWPQFMDLYAPMNMEVIALLKGIQTPEAAAAAIEAAAAALR
jgi:raffinose/stachyose/melibiose transport system substrate-binding protein